MMFVLQLLDHHCTLLFGPLAVPSVVHCVLSAGSTLQSDDGGLTLVQQLLCEMYIYLILCVYRVNCLKGYKLFCPQLLFPEGEELDTLPLCSWAR